MKPLKGKIALVTGASRGAGRGIAQELGAAGATVYVTGRSSRSGSRTLDRPESIEETADMVTALGGNGIPVRVDHTVAAEVAALFDRIKAEQGHLDILVNNVWGGHDRPWPGGRFWETAEPPWQTMFDAGVRANIDTSRHAVPLMLNRPIGLIATVSYFDQGRYTGNFWYDLAKNALTRMAFGMAQDLKDHAVASVAVSPGFMRTELVLGPETEETWQSVPRLARTETPRYVGRAIAALAADPGVMAKTGQALTAGDLAREYGLTDVDGRYIPPFTH